MSIDYSKVVCFDMEMCCWEDKPNTGEIISIGLCELNLVNFEISREKHYFVKPRHDEVSDYCRKLTGITQKMVDRQGRSLEDVLLTITNNFGTRRPYVAWGTDADYLARQCNEFGFSSPLQTSIDVGLLYRIKQRNGPALSLTGALEKAGLQFEGQAHNALVDAKNLARLIIMAKLL